MLFPCYQNECVVMNCAFFCNCRWAIHLHFALLIISRKCTKERSSGQSLLLFSSHLLLLRSATNGLDTVSPGYVKQSIKRVFCLSHCNVVAKCQWRASFGCAKGGFASNNTWTKLVYMLFSKNVKYRTVFLCSFSFSLRLMLPLS